MPIAVALVAAITPADRADFKKSCLDTAASDVAGRAVLVVVLVVVVQAEQQVVKAEASKRGAEMRML